MDIKLPVEEQQLRLLAEVSGESYEELSGIKSQAIQKSLSFREVLLQESTVSDAQFQEILAELSGYQFTSNIPLDSADEFLDFLQNIPAKTARKNLTFPLSITETALELCVVYPSKYQIYEEIASILGKSLNLVLSTEDVITSAINHYYKRNSGTAEEAAGFLEEDDEFKLLTGVSLDEAEDLLDSEDDEPVKRLVNTILYQSIKDEASDIHIDPGFTETDVRNRVDGVLRKLTKVPRHAHQPLINRVKVMGGLDIAVKNRPQDGRTMIQIGGNRIDLRISILPTIQGERAVLRILNQSQGVIGLEQLGLETSLVNSIRKTVRQPHGMILVTGPTGSGKTSTLYAALQELDASQKNIITIEDPVEYKVSDYGQIQVNEKAGLTFASGLRSILRQDPDVIMVGEIRDPETAKIAVQSALTGHLVLSTLHTNDAVSSVIRLMDMGIEPFLISSVLRSVIAQRLVRRLCRFCKEEKVISWDELAALGFPEKLKRNFQGSIFSAKGCEKCMKTGYKTRVGVFEYLQITDSIREVITSNPDDVELKREAQQENIHSLMEDCAQKVLKGETSLEEMFAVVINESPALD